LRPNRPIFASVRRPLHTLVVLLSVAALGCAAIEHSYTANEFAGKPLSPKSSQGSARFQSELQHDQTLARYVAEHGRPDYFYLVDRQKLYFFYIEGDRAAMFERVVLEPSQVTELGRIPGSLLKMLPAKVRQKIEARRSSNQRRAQQNAKRARSRIAAKPSRAPSPAARAPGGVYIGGFETTTIVARMRAPLTAADPGVSGWKKTRLRNGKTAYTAKVGRTSYEVRDERIAFTVFLSASRKNLPGSARLAIKRVNDAIFAAKAGAVTQQMMALAERAAADRTGRTTFSRRVAGRTIRLGRRVGDGVFAYSIHP
jgi:hypothetical protein